MSLRPCLVETSHVDNMTGPHLTVRDGSAIADASHVASRIREDERGAREERQRLSSEGLVPLEADLTVAGMLRTDEHVTDVREACQAERLSGLQRVNHSGRLYVTSERLIIGGARGLEIEMRDIEELELIGERLMVRLRDGTGVGLDIPAPRVLRVRIAFALGALRR